MVGSILTQLLKKHILNMQCRALKLELSILAFHTVFNMCSISVRFDLVKFRTCKKYEESIQAKYTVFLKEQYFTVVVFYLHGSFLSLCQVSFDRSRPIAAVDWQHQPRIGTQPGQFGERRKLQGFREADFIDESSDRLTVRSKVSFGLHCQ